MGILASPGDAANGCAADADTAQGQNAAAGAVEPGTGAEGTAAIQGGERVRAEAG